MNSCRSFFKKATLAAFCAVLAAGFMPVCSDAGVTNANVISRDLRAVGVEAYLKGFLGNRAEYLIAHPAVLGGFGRDGEVYALSWLYSAAYPATSWSWSGAVLGEIKNAGGDMVEVIATKPRLGDVNSSLPRSVREWMFNLRPGKDKSVQTEDIKRSLRIDNAGVLFITAQGYESMKSNIERDMNDGLLWCIKNASEAKKNTHLMEHLGRIRTENRLSSTVKLPLETASLLEKAGVVLFGK